MNISSLNFFVFPFPHHHAFLSDENEIVKLQLKDLELEFSWPVSRIREALGVFVGAISSPTTCPAECLKSIASLVEDQNIPEVKIGLASGVAAFLWLCSSILGYAFHS